MAVCATIRACAAAPTPHSAAPVVAVRADAARALGVFADRRTAPAVIGATAAALLALFVAWPLLLVLARGVTLALARPGLVWAALSVFVRCLSDVGNPFLIGGDFGVLTTEIYVRAARAHDLGGAAALSVPLIVPCLVAHALTAGWLGAPPRPSRWTIHLGAGRRLSSRARGLVVVAAAGSALALLCLYGGIALASILRLSGTRPRLSLMHYRELGGAAGTSPIVASLVLALLAAGVGGVLATAIGRLATRPHAVAVTLIERWARLPAALPGTVL